MKSIVVEALEKPGMHHLDKGMHGPVHKVGKQVGALNLSIWVSAKDVPRNQTK